MKTKRSVSLSLKEMRQHPLELELADEYLLAELQRRPRTRGDCVDGPRPCPYLGCKYHLALDVSPAGSLFDNFPNRDLDELEETCALDVADRGGVTLERIGELLNVTRERIRQIEARVLRRAGTAWAESEGGAA